jgi:hypothetical protein
MADSTERDDARVILGRLLEPWANASWEALDQLEAAEPYEDEVEGPSGRSYRVKLLGDWDMKPWESDFYVWARVYGRSGWRKRFPYLETVVRGGEGLPREPPPTTRWVKDRHGRWEVALGPTPLTVDGDTLGVLLRGIREGSPSMGTSAPSRAMRHSGGLARRFPGSRARKCGDERPDTRDSSAVSARLAHVAHMLRVSTVGRAARAGPVGPRCFR